MENLLQLFSWTLFSLILVVVMFIARFYERKSGRRTFYQFYPLAIFLFLAAALIYTGKGGDFVGDFRGDVFFSLGGLLTSALAAYLFELMMGKR
ncbi:MAG: hypothetical protein RMK30_00585 [Anaerolineae bacterium]|nr:hypothetical protein [Anaerolineae bacterium]MDW8101366.1 hypothetical protein [Anaerolineae bacterium]